jgi:hypothetical protein
VPQTTISISDLRAELAGQVIAPQDAEYDEALSEGGIVLDLSPMNALELDLEARTPASRRGRPRAG